MHKNRMKIAQGFKWFFIIQLLVGIIMVAIELTVFNDLYKSPELRKDVRKYAG